MHNIDSMLKLSYAPFTVFEFDGYRTDEYIYQSLASTSIYVIAKRTLPVMRILHSASNGIRISAKMEGNSSELQFIFRQQENPNLFGENGLSAVQLGSNILGSSDCFNAITFFRSANGADEHILTANLDRFIHLASHDRIHLLWKGDIEPFVSYEVLYVGQCVGEHIFRRFKAHHALMNILIKENIIPPNYDKVNDLVILPFTIESDVVSVITGDAKFDEFAEAMTGNFSFGTNEIALDCEKALVRAMTPKYNKTRFKQYPKSSDGLYDHKLDSYNYRILENIVLCYGDNNKIYGDVNGTDMSIISVVDDQDFYIFK